MSWAVYYESKQDFFDDKRKPEFSMSEAPVDQLAAARAAAMAILSSFSVGDQNDEYVFNLSGHCNPGHRPREAWANDCVSVSVQQKYFPPSRP